MPPTPIHPLAAKLAESWPPTEWQGFSVVLAVSGGSDSVALLRLANELRGSSSGRLLVGHFNHAARGASSDGDQQFVEDLCESQNVPCEVGLSGDHRPAADRADGFEAAARRERYDFLQSLAERHGARYIVTAHTADDQAETILHRILRGTGIKGLAGIPRTRALSPAVSLLRPMLPMARAEIQKYLDDIGQPYRMDASNLDTEFTRNRIRHQLLPSLRQDFNPAIDEALLRLGRLAGEAQQATDEIVDQMFQQIVSQSGDAVHIDCQSIAGTSQYIVRELLIRVWRLQAWPLQAMGLEQWEVLAEMVTSDGDMTATLPGNVRAQKKDEQLALTRPL